MNGYDREPILRRFAEWLDQAMAQEEPPRGIPAEILECPVEAPAGEMYAVQAALTALTQEVILQSRSFKQLSETVAPVADLAPALATALEDARTRARRETLDPMLDVRDRLARGADTARAAAKAAAGRRRWWRPESPEAAAVVAALREGYELAAARLDEVLAAYGVREIECVGRLFDAGRHSAVSIDESGTAPEGTVVEVYRRGYTWNGVVYRPAEVRVARGPGGLEEQADE
jgi:molecular chaperone GrpE